MAGLNCTCSSCQFFCVAFGDRLGVCRRFPSFQNRSESEWCGEFKYKGGIQELPVVDMQQVVDEALTSITIKIGRAHV